MDNIPGQRDLDICTGPLKKTNQTTFCQVSATNKANKLPSCGSVYNYQIQKTLKIYFLNNSWHKMPVVSAPPLLIFCYLQFMVPF